MAIAHVSLRFLWAGTLILAAATIVLSSSLSQAAGAARKRPVRLGVEQLLEHSSGLIRGKRLGLITNPTGVDSRLHSTADLLHRSKEASLVKLFAPEHGLRGDRPAGDKVSSHIDTATGLPVLSLYGATRKPTPEMLEGLDALLFDIQDIGARQYTYIYTMAYAMEAAAKEGIEFIVLDRPNPLGGEKVEGPLAEREYFSFTGLYPLPVVHGMTVGELARLFNSEYGLGTKLTVVKMTGWRRDMVFPDTGLPWVPTSPNIPSYESAFIYPGMGIAGESGLFSVGVGTPLPFQIAGAPWIDATRFSAHLARQDTPGVTFRPTHFVPFGGKFIRKETSGVQVHVVDPRQAMPLYTAVQLMCAARDLYPGEFKKAFSEEQAKRFTRACKTDRIRSAIMQGQTPAEIRNSWSADEKHFRKLRAKYLLYR